MDESITTISKKERILQAARELFVEKGFMGTSVNEIIARAKVTHSLLFHHFKNKETLWQIVKNQIVEEGKGLVENFPSLEQPLRPFLFELINYAIHFYGKNPDIVRILSWQRLIPDSKSNTGIANIDLWMSIAEHYKKMGEIKNTIPSEYVVTFTLAVVTALVLDPNPLLETKIQKEEYIKFLIDNLIASYNS
jgi:AcrR family transcriptional regulator